MITVFAAFKQAYKSGSFDIVIPSPPPANKSFGDEKVQGGEVGIKSRWLLPGPPSRDGQPPGN